MPKSTSALSPTSHGKLSPNDTPTRMSDVALRKKKNADAQAAFRARRANYIATLEETVTSLESVVLQLQESCREAKNETMSLQQENSRLQHEFEKREKFWRALWQAKKSGQDVEPDDPSSHLVSSMSFPSTVDPGSTAQLPRYDTMPVSYSQGESSMTPNDSYSHFSSSIPYSTGEQSSNLPMESSTSSTNNRNSRYSPYPYSLQTVQRDTSWSSATGPGVSPDDDLGLAPHGPHSRSPNFADSPVMVAHNELAYPMSGHNDDEKGSLSSLDAAPYMFPTSRSLSPQSSTPSSSTYPFNTSTNMHEHGSDYDYRRHQPTEIALHSGTADILNSSSDAGRYRIGSRLPATGLHNLPALPRSSLLHEENSSQAHIGFGPRSRSPSPGAPAISGTLAVIKAQAFGALRRTRARSKKSADGAAKVALNVLEARGIGMGGSDPNQGSQHSDDEDLTS